MAVSLIFLAHPLYGFSGFAKKVTSCSPTKTVLKVREMHDKPSLFSSH